MYFTDRDCYFTEVYNSKTAVSLATVRLRQLFLPTYWTNNWSMLQYTHNQQARISISVSLMGTSQFIMIENAHNTAGKQVILISFNANLLENAHNSTSKHVIIISYNWHQSTMCAQLYMQAFHLHFLEREPVSRACCKVYIAGQANYILCYVSVFIISVVRKQSVGFDTKGFNGPICTFG